LELNATHQLLFYANVVNILGENMNTVRRTTKSDVRGKWEVDL